MWYRETGCDTSARIRPNWGAMRTVNFVVVIVVENVLNDCMRSPIEWLYAGLEHVWQHLIFHIRLTGERCSQLYSNCGNKISERLVRKWNASRICRYDKDTFNRLSTDDIFANSVNQLSSFLFRSVVTHAFTNEQTMAEFVSNETSYCIIKFDWPARADQLKFPSISAITGHVLSKRRIIFSCLIL